MARNLFIARMAAAGAVVVWGGAARAVIFDSTSNPSYNTAAPTGSLAGSGWQYEAPWSSFLATPVDPYHFLTAAHIGGAVGDQLTFQGTTYTTVPFADSSPYHDFGDLRLFQVDKPFYSYAPLYNASSDGSEVGKGLVDIGRGRQRGTPVVVGGVTKGWQWGALDGVQRWGQNIVSSIANYATAGDSKLLQVNFDASGAGYSGVNEATLAEGDSGGGVFINVNGQWKLAGINYAVAGPYGYTATDTPFMAALTDTGGLYNRNDPNNPIYIPDTSADKPSSFYASRISQSLSAIEAYLHFAPTWNINASGNWSAASNWSGGTVPNGIGAEADFRSVITAPRTINVDASHSLGTIDFDDANGYTLAGSGTLTLDVASGSAAINVASGNQTIAAPLALNDPTVFNIIPANSSLTISGSFFAAGRSLTKTGAGRLSVPNVRAASLSINSGSVKVAPNGTSSGTSKLSSLSIAGGASMDLTNNGLIVGGSNTGTWNGSGYTGVTGMITSGRLGSSLIAPQNGRAIGVASAADVLGLSGTRTASWNGQSVSAGDTLVMYTWAGDANLDGKVNIDDYARIDSNVGRSGSVFGWYNGDFNLDGKINIDDYGLIDRSIGMQGLAGAAADSMAAAAGQAETGVQAVPEPSLGFAGLLAATWLCGRRRRRASRINSF